MGVLLMFPGKHRRYLQHMKLAPGRRLKRTAGVAILALAALPAAGCMNYAADGSVVTPPPPAESSASRLPQLLSQLQGSGAGVEVFGDDAQSQVLAAQDEETTGKSDGASPDGAAAVVPTPTPTSGATVAGTRTPSATATPRPSQGAPTPTPTPTPQVSEASPPTPTPTPTMTPTPVPPTPRAPSGPPSESGGGGVPSQTEG